MLKINLSLIILFFALTSVAQNQTLNGYFELQPDCISTSPEGEQGTAIVSEKGLFFPASDASITFVPAGKVLRFTTPSDNNETFTALYDSENLVIPIKGMESFNTPLGPNSITTTFDEDAQVFKLRVFSTKAGEPLGVHRTQVEKKPYQWNPGFRSDESFTLSLDDSGNVKYQFVSEVSFDNGTGTQMDLTCTFKRVK